MKAITTKYVGATNTKSSRIVATDGDNKVSIGYPHELDGEDAHRAAADALMAKMGWSAKLVGGATKGGYAFVMVPSTFKAVKRNPAKSRSKKPVRKNTILEVLGTMGAVTELFPKYSKPRTAKKAKRNPARKKRGNGKHAAQRVSTRPAWVVSQSHNGGKTWTEVSAFTFSNEGNERAKSYARALYRQNPHLGFSVKLER